MADTEPIDNSDIYDAIQMARDYYTDIVLRKDDVDFQIYNYMTLPKINVNYVLKETKTLYVFYTRFETLRIRKTDKKRLIELSNKYLYILNKMAINAQIDELYDFL